MARPHSILERGRTDCRRERMLDALWPDPGTDPLAIGARHSWTISAAECVLSGLRPRRAARGNAGSRNVWTSEESAPSPPASGSKPPDEATAEEAQKDKEHALGLRSPSRQVLVSQSERLEPTRSRGIA